MQEVYLIIVLMPLCSAIISGLLGHKIGRTASHYCAIFSVAVSFLLSILVLYHHTIINSEPISGSFYTWLLTNNIQFQIGFLVDHLTAIMICTVTFVSLMVHIYTVGYMQGEAGYERFFSYISLFTFAMLILVISNNFLQLFFGWEGVGLVSYLLIGFWYKRETAILASLKAFLVNRVGDIGFLLGIAIIFTYCENLDYYFVFNKVSLIENLSIQLIPGVNCSVITLICTLLFIGAMGKSAQIPLHIWLPDSMEGPTPISALIHAATMVTAGIFMVTRLSPLFEASDTALSLILIIGSLTALLMGIVGITQYDIKRIIAYSTISQLGYMTVALGVSAYPIAIFHLMTHAFFKALLFLCAGSVILAMHHEQDIRKMGGLWKKMPITWLTFLIGTFALVGIPGLSGFYSKDSILEAVYLSKIFGSSFAYFVVMLGILLTAIYSFRLYLFVFHGICKAKNFNIIESPITIRLPLLLLSIPTIFIGALALKPIMLGNFFNDSILILPEHNIFSYLEKDIFDSAFNMAMHGIFSIPFILVVIGFFVALCIYLDKIPILIRNNLFAKKIYNFIENKYFIDELYRSFFVIRTNQLGTVFWKIIDAALIDGIFVNGTTKLVVWVSDIIKQVQSGYLNTYAFVMIIGLMVILIHFVKPY